MRRKETFDGLKPELRRTLARYLIEARRKDRGQSSIKGWRSQSRGIREYFFCLGILPTYLEAWIERRVEVGEVALFEAGMGRGFFCRELLHRFAGRLRAEGMRLTFYDGLKEIKGLRQRVGILESFLPEGNFDLGISARGAFVYSVQSFAAVEVFLNSLRPGSIAYVDDAKLLLPKPWFREYLSGLGIHVEVTRYERGGPYAYKFIKMENLPLDLSSLSRRYVDRLNAESKFILRWGFDRTPAGSPISDLFSSLYEHEHYKDLLPGGIAKSAASRGAAGDGGRNRSLETTEILGVTFINDAHSQSVQDLREALATWEGRRVFWIAGGAQASELEKLARSALPLAGAFFFGEGRRELAAAWRHLAVCLTGQELKDAVEKSYHVARPGDVVLFSPALAPDPEVHGSCENREADFRRCVGELGEMSRWKSP
ncbi:hypothetical protein FBR05_09700 [Deltaproteobacteria bacterium PRO3]|nr:hypothetical protein [Deltaproteobacteria bacterium PRO3]